MNFNDFEPTELRDSENLLRVRRVEPIKWTAEYREHVTDPWQLLPETGVSSYHAVHLLLTHLDLDDPDQEDQPGFDDVGF